MLRDDGTLWLNLGDSYAGAGQYGGDPKVSGTLVRRQNQPGRHHRDVAGLKPKDLIGQPWRVAFALQAAGWYLRSDIIWHKPNPMPESCTDRPTKSHEYLFLLTKAPRYYYDADAVREGDVAGHVSGTINRRGNKQPDRRSGFATQVPWEGVGTGRNRRTVWTIPTHSFPGAHFATFPPKLVEPCIAAGTSEHGVCPECGDPWARVATREFVPQPDVSLEKGARAHDEQKPMDESSRWDGSQRGGSRIKTTGWQPTCECFGRLETVDVPCEGTNGPYDPSVTEWEMLTGIERIAYVVVFAFGVAFLIAVLYLIVCGVCCNAGRCIG